MQPRFYTFAHALRSAGLWPRHGRPSIRPGISQYICRSCQSKFSTSSVLRQIAQATKKAVKNVTKNGSNPDKLNRYPTYLKIYDSGDQRRAWVGFWKGTAIFQFGAVAVFLSPLLYKNENQPDPNIRLLQAVGLTVASAIPMMLMSYLTTPFVKKVAIELPAYAQRSRDHLMNFSRNLPAETRLEFTTLRAFPFEKKTGVFLFELRALPAQRWRFANIERVKTELWKERQKKMRWYRRVLEVINEPRFKFYVKEGRNYTIKTGVPGVWENVARAIQQQTSEKDMTGKMVIKVGNGNRKGVDAPNLVSREPVKRVKRQTARSSR